MTAPSSYLAIDPGRKCGWACCLAGGHELRYGTWKFTQTGRGAAFTAYRSQLRQVIETLPDVQIGIELLTVVPHEDEKGNAHVDARQILISAGWQCHLENVCDLMRVREPEDIAIVSWRSKTHGKVVAPKGLKQSERTKFFKDAAFAYCDANGWEPDSDNSAEALCILDYLRIQYEPSFAFGKGRAFQQESLL